MENEIMYQPGDLTSALQKAAPPVVVSAGVTLGGMSLNEWVAIATLVYVGLQILVLLKGLWNKRRSSSSDQ